MKHLDPHQNIAVEWHEDQPFTVPIQFFDPAELDTEEANIREALRQNRLGKYLADWETRIRREAGTEAGLKLFTLLLDFGSKAEQRCAVFILFAAGVRIVQERTGSEWARYFGFTKQNFDLHVLKWRERLKLPKTRTMRTLAARKKMSEVARARKKKTTTPPQGDE